MSIPLLEENHEKNLATRWLKKKDEKALHELTQSHIRLVVSFAMKYKNYGLNVSDLIQEGNIGLMKSADRFDISKEVRFSTYASWWIRASIQDYVLKNWSLVRIASTSKQKSLFFSLRKLKQKIQSTDNGTIDYKTAQGIAESLNISTSDVVKMDSRLSQNDGSLNNKISEDGSDEFLNLIEDEDARPDDIIFEQDDVRNKKKLINLSLETLDERELQIIKNRHLSDAPKTLEVLGGNLRISKERVRQIEKNAMIKMKSYINNQSEIKLLP
jgi:RNA polymerase sigma-32 factor